MKPAPKQSFGVEDGFPIKAATTWSYMTSIGLWGWWKNSSKSSGKQINPGSPRPPKCIKEFPWKNNDATCSSLEYTPQRMVVGLLVDKTQGSQAWRQLEVPNLRESTFG